MLNLSIVEKFALCVLDEEKVEKHFFYSGKYPACIVAAIFMELLLNELVTVDEKKKIIINKEFDTDKEYLKLVYNKILSKKSRSLKKWIEYYVAGFSNKSIKEIVDAVIKSLVLSNNLQLENKRCFVKKTINYNVDKHQLEAIIQNIRTELLEKNMFSKESTILVSIMLQCNLLRKYFSKQEEKKVKELIKEIKNSEVWSEINSVKEVFDEFYMIFFVAAIV